MFCKMGTIVRQPPPSPSPRERSRHGETGNFAPPSQSCSFPLPFSRIAWGLRSFAKIGIRPGPIAERAVWKRCDFLGLDSLGHPMMKTLSVMIAGIALGLLMSLDAMAENSLAFPAGYNAGTYASMAQNDTPPAVAKSAPDAAKADEAAKPEENADEEKADEPHRVIGKVGCTGINIYGWLDAGITGNADSPASRYNGTLAPNDRNEFQFNQSYLVIEKTLNTDHGWDIGGRIDLLYGTDYIYCESLGFETNPDGSRNGMPANNTAWPCLRPMPRWASASCRRRSAVSTRSSATSR